MANPLSEFREKAAKAAPRDRGVLSDYLDKLLSGRAAKTRPRAAAPESDQERRLRAEIEAGGQTVYADPQRAPLEGVLSMDPFEMATGMPLSDGNEDYGALTQMATSGVSNYATPAYLQPGYEGPQTGLGPVGDALAGLGQVFQGGNVTGPMGAPSTVLSQYAGRLPAADRAFGTAGGTKIPGRGLGKGLSDLVADEADAARPTLEPFTKTKEVTNIQRWFLNGQEVSAPTLAQSDVLQWLKSQGHESGTISAKNIDDVIAAMKSHYGELAPAKIAKMRELEGRQFAFTPDQVSYEMQRANPEYWTPIRAADDAGSARPVVADATGSPPSKTLYSSSVGDDEFAATIAELNAKPAAEVVAIVAAQLGTRPSYFKGKADAIRSLNEARIKELRFDSQLEMIRGKSPQG